jgi:hypothetical protein
MSYVQDFLSVLAGVLIYKGIIMVVAPRPFDFAAEAVEAIVFAAAITVVFVLIKRWRGTDDDEPNP